MKKLSLLSFFFLVIFFVNQSCDNQKTYAEMLEDEKEAVEDFVNKENIRTISTATFFKDTITNLENNEFVLFKDNGVYMQIVNRGEGKKPESGDQIIVRFTEVDIMNNDTLSNTVPGMTSYVDEFRYEKTDYSVKATFLTDNGGGLMVNIYGTTAVPNGWLIPLDYIYLSRKTSDLAKIRLIVPSKMGQADAIDNVYPCYYELTYQLSR